MDTQGSITLDSYLEGKWQSGVGVGASLYNPTTGVPVATASTTGLNFQAALEYGRTRGGPALRAMSFARRGEMLEQITNALRAAREALLDHSIMSTGTTRGDAKFDVDGAIGTLAYYAQLGRTLGERTFLVDGEAEKLGRSARFAGYHIKVPLRGVAVHINAFNFPAWGMAEKAAVALLAGVPILTKPATSTAWLALEVMRRIVACGAVPDGAWQLVCGSPGEMLEHLGSQDLIAFTGSADTAARIRALPNVIASAIRVNVEADSLNAAVLAPGVEDETYQMFLRDVLREITQKAGQKCTATRRIFVPADQLEQVQADLIERLERVKVGDPGLEGVQVGPLATRQQLADARAGVKSLVDSGAAVVFGSPDEVTKVGAESSGGFFLSPMLLRADHPAKALRVHSHEVFGPVSTLMPFSSAAEVAGLVALGDGGLVASLYSDDREFTSSVLLELAPYHGRVFLGSSKVADSATTPGMVLPGSIHGGPGRAGGGEELGGLRGLDFYLQRCAVQGDRGVLDAVFGVRT